MPALVLGPSSVGKSTFLRSSAAEALQNRPRLYGFQVEGGAAIPPESVVHYNILHQAISANGTGWSIKDSPVLNKLLSKPVDRCIVLATSVDELKSRMAKRELVEQEFSHQYDRNLWLDIADRTDFFALYEDLLDHLTGCGVEPEILISRDDQFNLTDRAFLHAHLHGRAISMPDRAEVEAVAGAPECEYQQVTLPYGFSTSRSGFDHLPDARAATLKQIMPRPLAGQSVLDIGCALGELLFIAERLGASEIVGLEPMENRYIAAIQIASVLRSGATLHKRSLKDFTGDRKFDHVFALSVLHHVPDFAGFLRKAAGLARKSLTLEFPTLTDAKFCAAQDQCREIMKAMNKLPFIATSSPSRADQHFVFSPEAIRSMAMDSIGGFSMYREFPSPIRDRMIMQFWR